MKAYPLLLLTHTLLASSTTLAHDWDASRPDSHAPISVMGDHTHKAGELMFSVRYMHMTMSELYDGKNTVSSDQALKDYQYSHPSHHTMIPIDMTMDMVMAGAMYASSDKTTWVFMLPYIKNQMTMIMGMDMNINMNMNMNMDMDMDMGTMSMFTTKSLRMSMKTEGVGDIKIGALHNLYDNYGHKVHLNLSLSLPTGSIDEKNNANNVLAYRMQLGSGTYDLLPGITYTAQNAFMSWGTQAIATIRTGTNKRDYTLGNRYKLQGWLQKPLFNRLSLNTRIMYEKWHNIEGEDKDLSMMKMMSPTADPARQGGALISAGLGTNIVLPASHRLALEYTKVLVQDLNGPQLGLDDSLMVAWQLAF